MYHEREAYKVWRPEWLAYTQKHLNRTHIVFKKFTIAKGRIQRLSPDSEEKNVGFLGFSHSNKLPTSYLYMYIKLRQIPRNIEKKICQKSYRDLSFKKFINKYLFLVLKKLTSKIFLFKTPIKTWIYEKYRNKYISIIEKIPGTKLKENKKQYKPPKSMTSRLTD